MISGSDLEHSHHAVHGIPGGDNSTCSKLHFLANAAERRAHGRQLAALRHQIGIADVEQYVQMTETGGVSPSSRKWSIT